MKTPQQRTQELGEQAQAEFARQAELVAEAATDAITHFTSRETAKKVVVVLKRQGLLATRLV